VRAPRGISSNASKWLPPPPKSRLAAERNTPSQKSCVFLKSGPLFGVTDLRANYPDFFWKTVRPYIGDASRYLRVTQRANSGLPISMQTCSRWSIEANFLRSCATRVASMRNSVKSHPRKRTLTEPVATYLETVICPGAKDAMHQQRPIPESPGSRRRLDFPPYGL
jgi:hypothetical protein